jgi:hypothetical protein
MQGLGFPERLICYGYNRKGSGLHGDLWLREAGCRSSWLEVFGLIQISMSAQMPCIGKSKRPQPENFRYIREDYSRTRRRPRTPAESEGKGGITCITLDDLIDSIKASYKTR